MWTLTAMACVAGTAPLAGRAYAANSPYSSSFNGRFSTWNYNSGLPIGFTGFSSGSGSLSTTPAKPAPQRDLAAELRKAQEARELNAMLQKYDQQRKSQIEAQQNRMIAMGEGHWEKIGGRWEVVEGAPKPDPSSMFEWARKGYGEAQAKIIQHQIREISAFATHGIDTDETISRLKNRLGKDWARAFNDWGPSVGNHGGQDMFGAPYRMPKSLWDRVTKHAEFKQEAARSGITVAPWE